MNSTALFDRMAASYDALWTTTCDRAGAARSGVARDRPALSCGRADSRYRLRHGRGRGAFRGARNRGACHRRLAGDGGGGARRGESRPEVCGAEELGRIRRDVRWRDLQFRRAELRRRSAARWRSRWPRWCVRGAASRSACWGASARGRRCTTARASSSARRSAGGRQRDNRADRGLLSNGGGDSRRLRARLRTVQRWTGIGLLVPPSYVKLPAALVARAGRMRSRAGTTAAPARAGRSSPIPSGEEVTC